MLGAGRHHIDACGIDARVSENVGKLGDILFDAIEGTGKEVSEVMGKDLARRHLRRLAERLHLAPDGVPRHGLPFGGDEDRARADALFADIAEQALSEIAHKEDPSVLALAGDLGFPLFHRLDRDILQLADADAA